METRGDLSPAMRRRFQTGRICLDFTHTGGEGEYARWELLERPVDAARFLGIIIGTEPPRVRRRDLAAIGRLRAAITTLARSPATESPPSPEAISVVNEAARNRPLVPQLGEANELVLAAGTATQARSTLARDAIALFASPLRWRIRICAADDCGLLFVDTSRPGRRRWCSMQWCGDRQKKRVAGRPVPVPEPQAPEVDR